jgi:hypothetical protein
MDDPTRRCENDTGNETHSSGPLIPSRGPSFSPRPARPQSVPPRLSRFAAKFASEKHLQRTNSLIFLFIAYIVLCDSAKPPEIL